MLCGRASCAITSGYPRHHCNKHRLGRESMKQRKIQFDDRTADKISFRPYNWVSNAREMSIIRVARLQGRFQDPHFLTQCRRCLKRKVVVTI